MATLGVHRGVLDAHDEGGERVRCGGFLDMRRHDGRCVEHAPEAVLVGAALDRGASQQSCGFAAQVVAGLVFDGQHREGVVGAQVAGRERPGVVERSGIGAVERGVDERKARAGAQDAGGADALEAFGLQLVGGQRERGSARRRVGVLIAVGTRAVVVLQRGYVAEIERRLLGG